jgi:NDP-sugar pyrophosphorylase family protein
MRAVILAGGKGTRLAPYTIAFPKPLMPICGTPILEIIILQLREYGFDDITLCTGYLAHLIETYFGDGSRLGVNISYTLEDQPLGTAGPLSLVLPCDEPILVMNADLLSTLDYRDMYQYHCEHGAALTVGLYPKHVKVDLGVLKTNGGNEVLEYIEKPEFEYQVSMGIYIIDPPVHRSMCYNTRLDFPDLVTCLLEDRRSVVGYPFDGHWIDIGRTEDYERACEEFLQHYALFLPESSGMLPAFRAAFPGAPQQSVAANVTRAPRPSVVEPVLSF